MSKTILEVGDNLGMKEDAAFTTTGDRMTDSLKDSQSTAPANPVDKPEILAVALIDNKPHWELTAPSVAYPFELTSGGKTYRLFLHLKQPYSSDKLVEGLAKSQSSYRKNPGAMETIPGDETTYAQLFDEAYVRLDGTDTDDPAKQKELVFNNRPRLKIQAIKQCLGGADTVSATAVPADEGEKLSLLSELMAVEETEVFLSQVLWNGKETLRVELKYHLRKETDQDWRHWERTAKELFVQGKKAWMNQVSWVNRLKMFDQMIISIDGFLLGGQPCTAANRARWINLVPAWHKLAVMNSVFDEVALKNG